MPDASGYLLVETKEEPDVFSLEGLIAWLEKQPGATTYSYYGVDHCLLTQWAQSLDPRIRWVDIPPQMFSIEHHRIWTATREMADIACGTPRTFGAALDRARSALSRARRG